LAATPAERRQLRQRLRATRNANPHCVQLLG